MNQSHKSVNNWLLVLGVVTLTVAPFFFIRDSEFEGADAKARDTITQVKPNYKPWFEPILSPPGGETESLLFSFQAALGAGLIGYAIGLYRGRSQK